MFGFNKHNATEAVLASMDMEEAAKRGVTAPFYTVEHDFRLASAEAEKAA